MLSIIPEEASRSKRFSNAQDIDKNRTRTRGLPFYSASNTGSPSPGEGSPATYRNAIPTINSPFGVTSSPVKIEDSPVASKIDEKVKFAPIEPHISLEKPIDLWNTPKRQLAPLIVPPKPGQDYK